MFVAVRLYGAALAHLASPPAASRTPALLLTYARRVKCHKQVFEVNGWPKRLKYINDGTVQIKSKGCPSKNKKALRDIPPYGGLTEQYELPRTATLALVVVSSKDVSRDHHSFM